MTEWVTITIASTAEVKIHKRWVDAAYWADIFAKAQFDLDRYMRRKIKAKPADA